MPPITVLEIVTDAYWEAGIWEAGETLPSDDAVFGASKLSRMLDAWDTDKLYVFASDFNQYTLVPNVQPLTIGQGVNITSAQLIGGTAIFTGNNSLKTGQYVDIYGCRTATFNVLNALVIAATPTNFQVNITQADIALENETAAMAVYAGTPPPTYAIQTQRPAKIESASIIQNGIKISRLNIRDDEWWANNRTTQIATSVPTDLYYSADFPNGQMFIWPIQTAAYTLELETWVNLADIADFTYPFYLPQGYRDAVTYSLAESLCPSYEVPQTKVAMLYEAARRARAKVTDLNSKSPLIATRDAGIPDGRGGSGAYFNWMNGSIVSGR
jgi:hypothetical protein